MNSNGKQNKKEETINVFGYISMFFSTRFHDSEEVVDDAVGKEEGEELSAYEQLSRARNITALSGKRVWKLSNLFCYLVFSYQLLNIYIVILIFLLLLIANRF